MFPGLTSDDIFRIETKRLWLRWPRASDAAAITSFASLREVACLTAAIPHPYPQTEAQRFILNARADNAGGAALVLAIAQKTGARQVIGLISSLPSTEGNIELGYVLAPPMWGRGFAGEALNALVDTLFRITATNSIVAKLLVHNIASRRVLEKAGFAVVESGLESLPARGGMHPCHSFWLDRKSWASSRIAAGESRTMAPMAQQIFDENADRVLAMAGEQIER